MNSTETSQTIAGSVIKMLADNVDTKITEVVSYKILKAMLNESANYPDHHIVAAKLANAYKSLPGDTTDEEVKKIAKASVELYNRVWATFQDDYTSPHCSYDFTKEIFLEFINPLH